MKISTFITVTLIAFSEALIAQTSTHTECTGFVDIKMSGEERQKFRSRLPDNRSMDYSNYESAPEMEKTLYLDFEGGLVMDTYWDDEGVDALPATYFNDAEKLFIAKTVAADFQPFKVNVTTRRAIYDSRAEEVRLRVVFTPTNYFREDAAGVAVVNAFGGPGEDAAWVFSENPEYAANTASHEIGHTMGLYHDGKSGGTEYYGGHNGWSPIMGSPNIPLAQWSKGEYQDANNTEKDISDIEDKLGFRIDDYGSETFPSSIEEVITGIDGYFEGEGLIANAEDKDVFMFKVDNGGSIDLTFGCTEIDYYNNLRIEAAIYDTSWTKLTSVNTVSASENLFQSLSEGVYYLVFDGVGYLDPLTDGYSDYGSLGEYTFTGIISQYNENLSDLSVSGEVDLEDFTCDESITIDLFVRNSGSKEIDSYSLVLEEANGTITEFEYNETLAAGDTITKELNITPSNFREWGGTVSITHAGEDFLTNNNEVSLGKTNYYAGNNIEATMLLSHAILLYDPRWKLYDDNGTLLFNYNDGVRDLNDGVITHNFCYPKI